MSSLFSGFARRAASATGRRSNSMMAALLQQRRLPRKAILERMLLLALSIVIFATVIASISITIGGLERSSRRTHVEDDGDQAAAARRRLARGGRKMIVPNNNLHQAPPPIRGGDDPSSSSTNHHFSTPPLHPYPPSPPPLPPPSSPPLLLPSASSKNDSSVVVLAWKPRTIIIPNFLSDEECEALIDLATPRLARSRVVLPPKNDSPADNNNKHLAGGLNPNTQLAQMSVRTSSGAFLNRGLRHHPIVRRIDERIAKHLALPVENGESLHVLRYREGELYKPHFDFFKEENLEKDHPNQRVATVLMYLREPENGGETSFPNGVSVIEQRDNDRRRKREAAMAFGVSDDEASYGGGITGGEEEEGRDVEHEKSSSSLSAASSYVSHSCGSEPSMVRGFSVRPQKGAAIIFYSLTPSGETDHPFALHGSCDVVKGEKWTATKWVRMHTFYHAR